MEAEDKLQALFKNALHGHTEKVSHEEIESINFIIARNSFFRFTIYNFNIYYAAAIFSGFLISLLLGSHYIYTNVYNNNSVLASPIKGDTVFENRINNPTIKKIDHTNTKIPSDNHANGSTSVNNMDVNYEDTTSRGIDTKKTESDLTNYKSASKSLVQTKENSSSNDNATSITIGKSIKIQNSDLSVLDTLHQALPDTVLTGSMAKPRKKIIIVQTDTIYQIDTVRQKFSKRRKK